MNDIDPKSIERQLRLCREQLRATFDQSAVGILHIGVDGRLLRVNHRYSQLLGYTRDEVTNHHFLDFTHPEDAVISRERFQALVAGEEPFYTLEKRYIRKQGEVVWARVTVSPYRDDAGALLFLVAVVEEITARRQAEERARYLAAIVDSSDDAIIGKDLNGTILSCNRGAEALYGYSAQELVGKRVYDLAPPERHAEIDDILNRIRRGERVVHHETVRLRRDGTPFDIALTVSPVHDSQGQVIGASTIGRDITAHKRAEEELRHSAELLERVFGSVHVLLAYLDRDFDFVKVNHAYAAADNRSPDFFPGKNHFDLYPDPENEAVFRRVVETGEAYIALDKPFAYAEHPEWETSYWDWILQPVKGAGGRVEGLVLSLLDVTDRKRTQIRLAETADELRERVKELSCINGVSSLLQRRDLERDELFRRTLDLLVVAFQFPQISCARLLVDDQEYRSHQFRETPWRLAAELRLGEASIGVVEVFYREERPATYEGPFLKEERKLIDTVAQILGKGLEERRERAAREASEARYRSLFEQMLDSYAVHEMIFDARGKPVDYRFLDVNPAFERLLGRRRSEIVGRTVRELMPDVEPFWIDTYGEIVHTGVGRRFEQYSEVFDRLFEVVAYRPAEGQFATLFSDITERRRAEEALRRLTAELEQRVRERTGELEVMNANLNREVAERRIAEQRIADALRFNETLLGASSIGIAAYRASGECITINPAAAKAIGASVAQARQQNFRELESWRHTGLLQVADEALDEGREKNRAIHVVTSFGKEVWLECRFIPFTAAGEPHLLLIFDDVTERKHAEQAIRDLNESLAARTAQLETANRDLEGFSYSVSHDLRTPLRAIDGFSRILVEEYSAQLDEEALRLLGIIRDNTEQMGQLIEDILEFSRMGRFEIKAAEVDMTTLVDGAWQELRQTLDGRRVRFELEPLPKAYGDPAMLRRVVTNLLVNALKFTRPREETLITVGGSTDGAEARYFVRDNGVGFDMRYYDRLFGVFQRLHAADEFPGTGIGLAIIKRIISRHRGRVWAEGKVGEGATFFFTLPAKEAGHGE